MKSPLTGAEMSLVTEERAMQYRKEEFHYYHQAWKCPDTGELFTTTEQDEVNMIQIYNQYRVKYGIPFTSDIKLIRKKYGLSASKMSEILGFGPNQYRAYENGDMPSEANGKVLSSISNPAVFLQYVRNSRNQFSEPEYNRIAGNVSSVRSNADDSLIQLLAYSNVSVGWYNGFVVPHLGKLKNIILYFLNKCGDTFITKMNKLLFFADFLSFKRNGVGLTGLSYRAIQFGPVPLRWDRLYSLIDDISMNIIAFHDGGEGIQLSSLLSPDMSSLSKEEKEILDRIVELYGKLSARKISELSHKEVAWINNSLHNELINYADSFSLSIQ